MLCEYGCGQEAEHQFKNGKWCCSKNHTSCLGVRKKNSEACKRPEERVRVKVGVCEYGCGQESKYQLKNRTWCCSKSQNSCPEMRRKESKIQKVVQNKLEVNEKQSKSSEESWKDPVKRKNRIDVKNGIEVRKKLSESGRRRSLNGHTAYMRSCIKNPSKEGVKLTELVDLVCKELDLGHNSEHKVLNYFLDESILKYKIAIEYDGHYHFDTEEHRQYHKKRQQEIETLGWTFLRYDIFHPFLTKEQLSEDISKMIMEV